MIGLASTAVVLRLLIVAVLTPGLVAGVIAAAARLLPESARLRRAVDAPGARLGYAAAHLADRGRAVLSAGRHHAGAVLSGVARRRTRPGGVGREPHGRAARRGSSPSLAMLGLSLHPLVRYQWTSGAVDRR